MTNFMFSVNATIPVFLVILIGYFLKQQGMLSEKFGKILNQFNFKVTLPLLLVSDIASVEIQKVFDGRYILFCMGVTTVSFFSIWAIARCVLKKEITGAFVQASFRGSAAILGIAFIKNMYGTSGMAPLMIIGAVPLYNIYSIIVLTFGATNKKKAGLGDAFKNIIKNPIIIAIMLGLVLSAFHLYEPMPFIIKKTVSYFADMASPLALIGIGIGFKGKEALNKMKPTVVASFIKLILLPALFLPIAVWMGFQDQKLIALLIMLGSPTTASCYVMAQSMDNDEILTSSIIVLTTLFSSVSLTFWIYLLKCFALIQ
ncbi:transporter [Lachnospiraceae bacterium KM106-2]|nr:transporter [Lachnospiraceae bacterium KM106-2]